MTAFELIDDIFRRPQGAATDMRRITRDQLKYLRDLIEQAGPPTRIHRGAPGSLVWSPEGLHRYVVTEDLRGNRHTLVRVSKAPDVNCGLLF